MKPSAVSPIATVVIVTYRSLKTVGATLSPLAEHVESGEIECVVVDNASGDGASQWIEENFPQVTVIQSEKNIGFGRACNLGAEHASSPYIVFINPDAVFQPSELRKLVGFMDEHPRAAIGAPSILHHRAGGLPDPRAMVLSTLRLAQIPEKRPLVYGEEPFLTDWLCGAVFLIRTSVFRDLSGFDPRFFMYFEETDLCMRTLRAGFEIWAVTTTQAEHSGGVSAKNSGLSTQGGNVSKYYFSSRYYYLKKYHGLFGASCAEIADILPVAFRELAVRTRLRDGDKGGLAYRLKNGFLRLPSKV